MSQAVANCIIANGDSGKLSFICLKKKKRTIDKQKARGSIAFRLVIGLAKLSGMRYNCYAVIIMEHVAPFLLCSNMEKSDYLWR